MRKREAGNFLSKNWKRQLLKGEKVQNYLVSIACVLKPMYFSDTLVTSDGCGFPDGVVPACYSLLTR